MLHALVIEDEPLIAMHVGDIAEQAGASTIDFAHTQHEAVEAALRHRPDIIISDVRLLAGTGPEAVIVIRRAYGDIPVIFITGNPEDCVSCVEASTVLTKPVRADHLIREFQRMAGSDRDGGPGMVEIIPTR